MTNTGDALAPGTRLHELEIERVLGSGGFGITYLARDLSLETWRAVKEYLPREWGARRQDGTVGPWTGGNTEDYQWGLEKFLEEARVLARFKHPHIVQVHRVFEALGTAYMVMEYVEGRTLASQVKAAGALSEDRVREVLDGLAEGLKEVHAAGLLHRDIKPGNVVVRQDGSPVLIDFGAARHAMGGQSGSLASVLTPGYAPIEQYPPGNRQGPWTDIYALGALTYCAVSGVEPKAATERTREDRLRPVVEVAPQGVSPGLATAVGAAMAVYQEDRPQDLEAWQRLLDAPAGPVVEKPLGPGSSRGETSASPRQWWLAGAAAVGVVGVVLALNPIFRNGAGPDEPSGRVETAAAAETEPLSRDGEPVAAEADREREAAATAVAVAGRREEALGLDRTERWVMQTGLEAAGFDVGEVDGEFGPRTREALQAWQAVRGGMATGYLNGDDVVALRAMAAQPIALDRGHRGSIADGGFAVGIWSFEGAAGQAISVEVSAGFYPYITLLSPSGEHVQSLENSTWGGQFVGSAGGVAPEPLLAAILPLSGEYQIWVGEQYDSVNYETTGGSYQVAVRAVEVAHLLLNTQVTGHLGRLHENDDNTPAVGIWAFDGGAGQVVRIGVFSDDFDPYIGSLWPMAERVGAIDYELPISGQYLFTVRADILLGDGGSYTVQVWDFGY